MPIKTRMESKQAEKNGQSPSSRIQREMESSLSPKFTEMKTGARTSRFGRPQKQTPSDINSVPTEISKFVLNHSPKRLKPKDSHQESPTLPEKSLPLQQFSDSLPNDNKENSSNFAENTNHLQESHNSVDNSVKQIKAEITNEGGEPMMAEDSTSVLPINEENIESPEQDSLGADEQFEIIDEKSEKEKPDLSDSDSALGSTASSHDNFFAGQILWGSFKRTSWYPCLVCPDEEGNIVGTNAKKAKVVNVKYFNLGGCASLNVKNVFEFKSVELFWNQLKNFGVKKSQVQPFTNNCKKSIEEAKMLMDYPIDERIAVFNKIAKFQRKQAEGSNEQEAETSGSNDRKSIDSALESSPPSASSGDEPTKDPIESYLEIMSTLNMTLNHSGSKREKKRPVVPKAETKVEQKLGESSSRARRSVRDVKKRKYEQFEYDSKSETSETKSADSSMVKQQVKRRKLQPEETLEDRFITESKFLRNIFSAVTKKKVCFACFETDKRPTFRCTGNGSLKCAGWFHESCSGRSETKKEEIRHQTGDSDDIIQTSAIKTYVTCKACIASVKKCFVCEAPVDLKDESQQCGSIDCQLAYHTGCLENFPQIRKGKRNGCPQHTCHTCFSKEIHSSGALTRCMKCPSAYHIQPGCVPAGSKILSQSQLICPRHLTANELKRQSKEKVSKSINTDWCGICNDSGSLVCCESCPSSFHYDCIGYEESDEKFICQECRDGHLPLYNTIVWARVGNYRWWPGLIMHDSVLPESVLKTKKADREFCIRFFGSYDYFWFTCERVFSYDGSSLSVKGGNSKLDSAFNTALEEAHQLYNLLTNDHTLSVNAKPKPYTKLLSNRPIAPVKLKKSGDRTQEPCGCSPADPSPCGRNSQCINMLLDFECNKATCPAGESCQNQKLSKRDYADLKIVPTGVRGFGAISQKDIPENTFVIEYIGDLINTAEFNKRMKAKLDNKEKEFYFLTVESDLIVDAEPAGNLSRFINHSCDPNCSTLKMTVDGNTRIGIFTNQFVKAGTELTFDYRMEFIDNKKTACYCGSSNCSGLIGEKLKPQQTAIVKKKPKRKAPSNKPKAVIQQPKKRRVLEATKDPIDIVLQKMPKRVKTTESEEEEKADSPVKHESGDDDDFNEAAADEVQSPVGYKTVATLDIEENAKQSTEDVVAESELQGQSSKDAAEDETNNNVPPQKQIQGPN